MAETPVWIVNAEHWPRAFLRAELIERGYDTAGFETLEDAVGRLMLPGARRPALLVVDRRGLEVDERTAALLARAHIPVLLIADIAHPGGAPLPAVVEILHRPLTIGDITAAVERLLSRRPAVGAPGAVSPAR